jgi:hypothetical protein
VVYPHFSFFWVQKFFELTAVIWLPRDLYITWTPEITLMSYSSRSPKKMVPPRNFCGLTQAAFYQIVAQHTRCHIHVVRGFEDDSSNSHEHGIIRVPHSELPRFRKRLASFKSSRAWTQIHEMQQFDLTRRENAYRYVFVKHMPVMPSDSQDTFCPKHYHQCRKGNCNHIPTTVPVGTTAWS